MSDLKNSKHTSSGRKQKEATYKAWKTIREKRRKLGAKDTKKITDFIDQKTISKIIHPEETVKKVDFRPTWEGNFSVKQFHKTPPDIACGPFWELRWAFGCPLDCSYCYLRGTTRGRMKPQYVKLEHTIKALDEAFLQIREPSIFNSGELSDSLMNPMLMEQIVDKFEEQSKHKIFLLTKFGRKNIQFLLENRRSQVICGWSINAPVVAEKWEKAAASPNERIKAAKMTSESGYDTLIRLDPIFPVPDWQIHYGKLVDDIFSKLRPARITLGTPRGLWKTMHYAHKAGMDMSWTRFFKEDSSWGKKISFSLRKEIYQFFFNKITSMNYPESRISICKETTQMWDSLGLRYTPRTCNCYGRSAFTF